MKKSPHTPRAYLWVQRLFKRPTGTPEHDTKLFVGRVAFLLAGVFLHATAGVIAFAVGRPTLGYVELATALAWLGLSFLARAGRHGLALTLAWLEAGIHIGAATVVLGRGSGFLLIAVGLCVVPFIVYGARQRVLRACVAAGWILFAGVMTLVMNHIQPVAELEAWQADIFAPLAGGLVMVALALIGLSAATATESVERRLEQERQRSESLLLNVLPGPVATRLKLEPGTIADGFDSVTVLFADIAGFTELASRVSSEHLVEVLNTIFSEFDRLVDQYGLEKIKTIGDAYMVAGGLPFPVDNHASKMARLALNMRDFIQQYAYRTSLNLDVRIGIHCGPVVAGVIGTKKFSYDLWGDTVNTASRMESHGEPGRIQVTEPMHVLLDGAYEFVERGEIRVKGKQPMRTWFLVGPRPTEPKSRSAKSS